MISLRRILKSALAIGLGCLLWPMMARAVDPDAGFLFDVFPLTLSTGQRTEALGPFFYSEESETHLTWGVPPLVSRFRDSGLDATEYDFLYPLLTYDRYGSEYRWQLFQLLSFSGGQNQEEQTSRRFTLFPLYFQQRSEVPEENYTALLPFYGTIKHRLFRDEIFFVMFPIYGETRKRDVVTQNYLYPLFHVRHGDGLEGWQFWPLIGREYKEPTLKTNRFGDQEIVAGHKKQFVLWPIFLNQWSGMGTENPQRQDAILPLYSILRSPLRDSTSVIWPLFTHITEREKQYSEWQIFWPISVFTRGEGKTTTRIWPLYSHAQTTNLESAFFLWPIYKYNRAHVDGVFDRERTRILFFLYSDTVLKNLETGTAKRRVDFWPLFTHGSDHNGNSRLQILAPLEPFVPGNKSIERNYSPLWSIWRSEHNPRAGKSSQSFFWNLYRRDVAPESKKCSLLFGLFRYQSGPDGNQLRLFYIPVANTKPAANDGPANPTK